MPKSRTAMIAAVILALLAPMIVTSPSLAQYVTIEGESHEGPRGLRPGVRFVRLGPGNTEPSVILGGHSADFGSASALVGSSADAAYIAVVSGEVRVETLKASAGEAILLPPYGRSPSVVAFDAGRMRAMFGGTPAPALRDFVAQLDDIAEDQSWGLFFGQYKRSVFDLQNPGGERAEAGRRSVMAAPEVARIRYSGLSDPDQIEAEVVARGAAALVARDAEALAQLLDPAPFGGDDLSGGGEDARRVVAQQIIAEHASAASGEVRRGAGQGVWRAGRITMRTRPFSDFVFISSVE